MNRGLNYQAQIPVVRRPEYLIRFSQPNLETTIVHVDILVPWSAEVKRKLADDWQRVKELHGGPLYALHLPPDPKHHKFLTMFGMKPIIFDAVTLEGEQAFIYST